MSQECDYKTPSMDSTSLKCAWKIIGKECNEPNLQFLQCKAIDEDPVACIAQGERTVACGIRVLRTLENECAEAFAAYKHAMKKNWHQFDECRNEERALINCWKEFRTKKDCTSAAK